MELVHLITNLNAARCSCCNISPFKMTRNVLVGALAPEAIVILSVDGNVIRNSCD
jgi:hypothetical protein